MQNMAHKQIILLVEGFRIGESSLAHSLQKADFEVALVATGRESLEWVQTHTPNLVVFNASSMRSSGARSCRRLRGVVVGLLLMVALRYRWGRWALLLLFIGTVALGFFLDLGTLLVGDAQTATDFGLQGRLEIWSRALYGLADFPFTGMGMNGFRQVVHILYPLFSVSPSFDLGHAHNHLLQAGLDLGIFGLIAYLGIWILSAALLWTGWKNAQQLPDRVLIIGLSGSLAAGWVFGIFDAIALGARPGFLWWLLLGLLVVTFDNIRMFASSIDRDTAADKSAEHESQQAILP